MEHRINKQLRVVFTIGLLTLAGCTKTGSAQASSSALGPEPPTATPAQPDPGGWHSLASPNQETPSQAARVAATTAFALNPPAAHHPEVTLPEGTSIRVRLAETLDTRRNLAGDRFTATLDEPLIKGDRVVVPKGTVFTGHVVAAKSSGRLHGHAELALTLDSFTLDGRRYQIQSSDSARFSKGHKKHNLGWIGGGTGGGALLGGIAGGGSGLLIGAGAGAAAGTVGSAVTGKRKVTLPAETELQFALKSPVSLR
jgi:hypothetical protein